jgi:hypothetical protein
MHMHIAYIVNRILMFLNQLPHSGPDSTWEKTYARWIQKSTDFGGSKLVRAEGSEYRKEACFEFKKD